MKSLEDQVIVITGASSGIGLTTAEMAAERGAAVARHLQRFEARREGIYGRAPYGARTRRDAHLGVAGEARTDRHALPAACAELPREGAKHAPPVYPPEDVAYAILKCAEKPAREVVVGGVPRLPVAMATLAPRLTDLMMERQMWNDMQREEPPMSGDSLDRPSGEDYGKRRGRQPGHVMKSSAYTRAALSDVGGALPFIAIGAVVAAGVAASRR